jgi:N-methylhydantoinase B
VDLSLYGDRFRIAPLGLDGGTAGALTTAEVFRGGKKLPVNLKKGARLRKGDLVVISTSGGAGFGDPKARAAELVRRDIEQGVLPAATAEAVYGFGRHAAPA